MKKADYFFVAFSREEASLFVRETTHLWTTTINIVSKNKNRSTENKNKKHAETEVLLHRKKDQILYKSLWHLWHDKLLKIEEILMKTRGGQLFCFHRPHKRQFIYRRASIWTVRFKNEDLILLSSNESDFRVNFMKSTYFLDFKHLFENQNSCLANFKCSSQDT